MKREIDYMGVLVFTNQKTLDYKTRPDMNCWWQFAKLPKRFCEENHNSEWRLYLAVKGIIQGYFIIYECDEEENLAEFESSDWHSIENGEYIKPHQGFEYYPKEVQND